MLWGKMGLRTLTRVIGRYNYRCLYAYLLSPQNLEAVSSSGMQAAGEHGAKSLNWEFQKTRATRRDTE